jgi:hypothetical protein
VALTVTVFRVMASRHWVARYQNSEEICYLNRHETCNNTLSLKCRLWKLLSFGRRHASTLNKDAVAPPQKKKVGTSPSKHAFTSNMTVISNALNGSSDFFVWNLKSHERKPRLVFYVSSQDKVSADNGDLDRSSVRRVSRSATVPTKEVHKNTHTHTHTHTLIRVFWHSWAAHATASEFLIIHGNFSGQSQWPSGPLEALYQTLIEGNGFRTAHTNTQHNQPVAPAVHRHETVPCRKCTSLCKSPSRKHYGFFEQ